MHRHFRILDRLLAVFLGALGTFLVAWHNYDNPVGFTLLGFAWLSPWLLWQSNRLCMALLVGYSLICCQGTYVMCDIVMGDPWDILHTSHDWLWLVAPYAALRLLFMFAFLEHDVKARTSP